MAVEHDPVDPAQPSLAWSALALMTGHQGFVKWTGRLGGLYCADTHPHLAATWGPCPHAPLLSSPSSTNGNLP